MTINRHSASMAFYTSISNSYGLTGESESLPRKYLLWNMLRSYFKTESVYFTFMRNWHAFYRASKCLIHATKARKYSMAATLWKPVSNKLTWVCVRWNFSHFVWQIAWLSFCGVINLFSELKKDLFWLQWEHNITTTYSTCTFNHGIWKIQLRISNYSTYTLL